MKKLAKIVFVLFACAMTFASCSSNDDSTSETDELVDKCYAYAKSNPDGFTIDIRTFLAPKEGIVVSYAETQDSHDMAGLKKAVLHALTHNHLVGGWYNADNGKYYYDSDTIFQENMLKEALEWGRKNKQMSVFILSEGRCVDIDYSD